MYNIGQKATCIMPNGDKFDCLIHDKGEHIEGDPFLFLKITSGEHIGKYSVIFESEIDESIQFTT